MKIINLEQGSPEWLAWRKTVITATEASILTGTNPWETPYKCWRRKLGLSPEKESNEAMERGKRLEPVIRERFIKNYGINMTPIVIEGSEYDFLGASLDGISDCKKYILEVKTGSKKLHEMAEQGIVPAYYADQIQKQLLLTKADKCFYVVGDENYDVVVEVLPDPNFEQSYIPKARAFWKCVALSQPPALQKGDYNDKEGISSWKENAEGYRNVHGEIEKLEKLKEVYRQNLIGLSEDQNCMGYGVKCVKTEPEGRIAYKEIPELQGIDLSKYRKESKPVWKVLVA
jgi:putative phage-type endonuclease